MPVEDLAVVVEVRTPAAVVVMAAGTDNRNSHYVTEFARV
jgi:hypothetical protein